MIHAFGKTNSCGESGISNSMVIDCDIKLTSYNRRAAWRTLSRIVRTSAQSASLPARTDVARDRLGLRQIDLHALQRDRLADVARQIGRLDPARRTGTATAPASSRRSGRCWPACRRWSFHGPVGCSAYDRRIGLGPRFLSRAFQMMVSLPLSKPVPTWISWICTTGLVRSTSIQNCGRSPSCGRAFAEADAALRDQGDAVDAFVVDLEGELFGLVGLGRRFSGRSDIR